MKKETMKALLSILFTIILLIPIGYTSFDNGGITSNKVIVPVIQNGVFMGNELADWGTTCSQTEVWNTPYKDNHKVLRTIEKGETLRLRELANGDGAGFVMVGIVEYIPLDSLCGYGG